MSAASVPVGLVAAVGRNGVIGARGELPWKLRSDLRHFKALTLGKPVIMGRKTFESIGRILPGRWTIVVSRAALRIEGVDVATSVEMALATALAICRAHGAAEIAIAGGGDIFAATIGLADALHMTQVDCTPLGDVHFPSIDPRVWREVSRDPHPASAGDEASFAFVEYRRR